MCNPQPMQIEFYSRIKFYIMARYPTFYEILRYTLGAVYVGKTARFIIKNLPENTVVINLGSGAKRIGKRVINVDIFPAKNVDIVADARALPFEDDSVDAVISEQLFEHVRDPQNIVKEIYRVLRPGGLVFVTTPFIIGYHSMPNDYYRWTLQGLRELMKDFKENESGTSCGPTSALVVILNEWIASFFSFGIKPLYYSLFFVFMIILAPLKILDFFVYKYKTFDNIALAFYYIGKK